MDSASATILRAAAFPAPASRGVSKSEPEGRPARRIESTAGTAVQGSAKKDSSSESGPMRTGRKKAGPPGRLKRRRWAACGLHCPVSGACADCSAAPRKLAISDNLSDEPGVSALLPARNPTGCRAEAGLKTRPATLPARQNLAARATRTAGRTVGTLPAGQNLAVRAARTAGRTVGTLPARPTGGPRCSYRRQNGRHVAGTAEPDGPRYSYRRETVGSMEAARRAGTTQAASAVTPSTMATAPKTDASVAFTS